MITVTPVRHKDVRGKELLYLILKTTSKDGKEGKEVIINVGEKTLKGVEELLNNKELPKANAASKGGQ